MRYLTLQDYYEEIFHDIREIVYDDSEQELNYEDCSEGINKEEDFNTNIEWALYNFNRMINVKYSQDKKGHNYNFTQLKEVTENFFRFISSKRKSK